jgi:electron transfer flavoprotein beta subunit
LGTETVKCTLPCLLTVVDSANQPRPASARRMIAYKMAAIPQEYSKMLEKWPEFETEKALEAYLDRRDLKITVWSGADAGVDYDKVGLSGSPTKVLKIDSMVLEASGSKEFGADAAGVSALVQELVEDYIL